MDGMGDGAEGRKGLKERKKEQKGESVMGKRGGVVDGWLGCVLSQGQSARSIQSIWGKKQSTAMSQKPRTWESCLLIGVIGTRI